MATTEAEFLSVRHAATVLDASAKTVRRYLTLPDDPLPAIRIGVGPYARIRIPRRELLDWLERRRVAPATRELVNAIVAKALGDA